MAIPDNIIDSIQEKTDIVEVISRYIPLKKLGRNYKALCPFHHEKTPSFVVSPDKQIYHCFGCGAGGNAFSFVMRYENVEFPEAAETLAKKAGIIIPRKAGERRDLESLANQLYRINELASRFFSASLATSPAAKEYLKSRGIGDEAIRLFGIGYAPDSWEAALNHFKSNGLSEPLLEKAGLAIKNVDKGSYYDRFRHRIIFPILDLKERVLGFGARVLDVSLPKYVNSPETYIYSKGKNLYGLSLSKTDIKREGYALVVEGYLDFLIPYQAGVKNMVATLGTALTVDQVKLLKRFANTAIMVYDPDEAGEAASLRNLDIFISEDVNVYIAELPKGYAPESYIRKFGTKEFTRLVKAAKNLFDYKFDKLSRRFDINSANGKAEIAREMLPTIARIDNAVLKSNLVKKLAESLSVDEESIRTELKKVKLDYSEERNYLKSKVLKRPDSKGAERMILAIILEGPAFIAKAKEQLSPEELKDTSIRDVVKAIFELHENKKEVTPAKLISHMAAAGEAVKLISEAAELAELLTEKERALEDCIARVKEDNVKDLLARIQLAIKTAHDSKDENKVKDLVIQYNGLLKGTKACVR